MYAEQLDDAAAVHAAALAVLEGIDPGDVNTQRYVKRLAESLSARQCVVDIGPKYLAALTALHLTTAARVAGKLPEVPVDDPDPGASALLRLVGGARQRNAPALDAAATPTDS